MDGYVDLPVTFHAQRLALRNGLQGRRTLAGVPWAEAVTSIDSVTTLGVRTARLDAKSTRMSDKLQVSDVQEPAVLSLLGLATTGAALSRNRA